MSEAVIVGIITLAGTLVTVFVNAQRTNNLVNYRMDQVEKKVSEHNGIKEDLAAFIRNTEVRCERHEQRLKGAEDRLTKVERKIGA